MFAYLIGAPTIFDNSQAKLQIAAQALLLFQLNQKLLCCNMALNSCNKDLLKGLFTKVAAKGLFIRRLTGIIY